MVGVIRGFAILLLIRGQTVFEEGAEIAEEMVDEADEKMKRFSSPRPPPPAALGRGGEDND